MKLFLSSIACACAGFLLALLLFSLLWFAGVGWNVILAGSIGCGIGCFFIPIIRYAMGERLPAK